RIHLSEAKINPGHGVDTMDDLVQVRCLLEQ
ncbi:MAG TPA: 3-deoxy-manno-octulosonate cytidylyltransferase, partial [Cryomorphaceae bacterium]|nr:3-deoxy-manno-octulosonate cytidylyltransferase [Cryomorphaceae bacterium]